MTHTPGPWKFDGLCQIVEVARPHMRVGFLPSNHAEYASSKANGRLIAAAPEMLAALLACREYWRDVEIPCRVDLHDQVTTAIFNAMGQPSYDADAVQEAMAAFTSAIHEADPK